MTAATAPVSSFDVLTGPVSDELLNAAAAATTRAVDDDSQGVLVIVLRPTADDHRVVAGGGTGVLRAAVSVAVGAGNDRLWRDAPTGTTAEYSNRALPEVVASAADAGGVRATHVGVVRRGDEPIDAVAIWFETWNGVARPDERRMVLGMLEAAAATEAERRLEGTADASPAAVEPEAPMSRTFDPDDPSTDGVTGVLTADAFERHLGDFDADEATIILIDLDDFDRIVADHGDDGADAVLRTVADRLVEHCRREDRIGRLGRERFGILLGDIERSDVLHVAKRLHAAIAEPLPDELGVASITATVALAHQDGLVDVEEMLEAAVDAVNSGKRSGTGRLVLAA